MQKQDQAFTNPVRRLKFTQETNSNTKSSVTATAKLGLNS